MEKKSILASVDHTLLKQTAGWSDIEKLIDEGIEYGVASVCIPPCYVRQAAGYAAGRVKICTVIGFPNGSNTTASKVFEAQEAVVNGADELDTVINIGLAKQGDFDAVLNELMLLKAVCGEKPLKVIVEACLLTEQEKIRLCGVVSDSGADYIKTSTGFAGGGATEADVSLFRERCAANVRVKAAGGIKSFADAQRLLNAGASRLGTSALVRLYAEKGEDAE